MLLSLQECYKAISLIGQGTYGNVYKCKIQVGQAAPLYGRDENIVAVKKFKKPGVGLDKHTQRRGNKCKRELHMLNIFSENPHPHVVRLLDHFHTQAGKLCLVFEHIDQTLLQVLEEHQRGMRENDTKRIIWQLLDGLKELHTRNIMHRDIKPENILINRQGILKICDLGFARYDPNGEDQVDGMAEEMTQYISTRWYRAPELLLRHTKYTKSVDIWSIGCLVVELVSGTPAFPGNNDVGVLGMILDSIGDVPQQQGNNGSQNVMLHAAHLLRTNKHVLWFKKWQKSVSRELRSFISMCLKTNPSERATVDELLNHEWLTTAESDWKTDEFKNDLHTSMLQTKSIHAVVMACKRLRMATGQESVQEKQNAVRRGSTKEFTLPAYKHTPISPSLPFESKNAIKHGYYTPQIESSRGLLELKDQTTRYWLDTPGGNGMMSPKLKDTCTQRRLIKATPCPIQSEAPEDENDLNTKHVCTDRAVENPAKPKKATMAKRLGGMIHKIFQ